MAATIDSEAYFEARRRAIGISDVTAAAMRQRGFTTLSALAFSSSYTPGQAMMRPSFEEFSSLFLDKTPSGARTARGFDACMWRPTLLVSV